MRNNFEAIRKTKITNRNAKHLTFEKHDLEEHIFEMDPSLNFLIKTIPEVTFRNHVRNERGKRSLTFIESNSRPKSGAVFNSQ